MKYFDRTRFIRKFPKLKRFIGLVPPNGYLAGGMFKDIFTGACPRDIDIYFEAKIAFDNCVAEYQQQGYSKLYENNNVVCYDVPKYGRVELVRRIFRSATDTISAFDFTVCKFAMNSVSVIMHDNFFMDLYSRKLEIDEDVSNAFETLQRVIKYIGYGFTIDTNTLAWLTERIRDLPDNWQYNLTGYCDVP